MENLTKEEWKKQLATTYNALVLDVRTPEECAEGMQENAEQLNFLSPDTFNAGMQQLDSNKTYFVYCRSGARSSQACQLMEKHGLTTYNLLGGMLEWDGKVVQPN